MSNLVSVANTTTKSKRDVSKLPSGFLQYIGVNLITCLVI